MAGRSTSAGASARPASASGTASTKAWAAASPCEVIWIREGGLNATDPEQRRELPPDRRRPRPPAAPARVRPARAGGDQRRGVHEGRGRGGRRGDPRADRGGGGGRHRRGGPLVRSLLPFLPRPGTGDPSRPSP